MAGARTYADSCGVARALDVVGERWALLVVRELLLGPKRFTDLRAALAPIAPDVLAERLRGLEASGVLRREELPPPAASRVYALTERGRSLEPVILALGRWGSTAAFPADPSPLSPDAALIALRSLFRPPDGPGADATYALRLGGQPSTVAVRGEALTVVHGAPTGPDAAIETDTGTLAAVLWHGRSPAAARRAGALRATGDRRALARFWKLFPLPA